MPLNTPGVSVSFIDTPVNYGYGYDSSNRRSYGDTFRSRDALIRQALDSRSVQLMIEGRTYEVYDFRVTSFENNVINGEISFRERPEERISDLRYDFMLEQPKKPEPKPIVEAKSLFDFIEEQS